MHVLIVSEDATSRVAVAGAARDDGVTVEVAGTIDAAIVRLTRAAGCLYPRHWDGDAA